DGALEGAEADRIVDELPVVLQHGGDASTIACRRRASIATACRSSSPPAARPLLAAKERARRFRLRAPVDGGVVVAARAWAGMAMQRLSRIVTTAPVVAGTRGEARDFARALLDGTHLDPPVVDERRRRQD